MPQTFGEKIRALRKENGLTLDQLADKTELSKSYIWELENKNSAAAVGGKNSKDCRGTWRDQRLPDG